MTISAQCGDTLLVCPQKRQTTALCYDLIHGRRQILVRVLGEKKHPRFDLSVAEADQNDISDLYVRSGLRRFIIYEDTILIAGVFCQCPPLDEPGIF